MYVCILSVAPKGMRLTLSKKVKLCSSLKVEKGISPFEKLKGKRRMQDLKAVDLTKEKAFCL